MDEFQENTQDDTLYFKTNVLIKSIIGKDLITNDHIAVLELVKNSFDALSKNVKVIFRNICQNSDELEILSRKKKERKSENLIKIPTSKSSKLLIQDYGKGMDITDIKNKWLNIAYSEKKILKKSEGRQFAGNKGVGRFSCDRLGKFLDIYTRVKDSNKFIHLFIDWEKFEVEDKVNLQIQDIGIKYEYIDFDDFTMVTGHKTFISGTLLEISHLRNNWDREKLLNLRRNLEKLINPNHAFIKNSFEVEIIASEFVEKDNKLEKSKKINGELKNRVYENLNFKTTSIIAKIDSKGEKIVTKLSDKGRLIFTLEEVNKYPLLKDISINIYYLNPYSKAYFKRQTGVRSKEFGSIFLFINGFRVPPYGDDGDDWLGLEQRKAQGHSRFMGQRELLGRIEIRDNENNFPIISNRAGVENNSAFKQLVDDRSPYGFYYKTHRILERYVVEGLNWDSSNQNEKSIEKLVLNDPNWNEEKEDYRESFSSRNKRALNVIKPIINAGKSDIINLTVNEDLVNEVIEEEIEKNNTELSKILSQITNSEYDEKNLTEFISNLEQQIKNVSSFGHDIEKNAKGFIKDKELLSNLSEVEKKLFSTRIELTDLQNKLKKEKEEKERIKKELLLEKEKNTYLNSSSKSLSEDAKGLIHNIKITAKNINSNVDTLYEKIRNDNIKNKEILRRLGVIKFNAEKALKISNLITRANFKSQANSQIINIPNYIEQYIGIYSHIYDSNQIEFEIRNKNVEYIKKVSILDLSLILDDLISNSEKAEASKIRIEFIGKSEDFNLKLIFSDNGRGLTKEFIDNSEKIFELGITRTDGSGIGLNSVRNALGKMKANIKFIGNGLHLKGASFQITFK